MAADKPRPLLQNSLGKTQFDICLLRVKESFTGLVNFARLPQMLLIVKGIIQSVVHSRISQNKFFFRWQGMFIVRMGYSSLPKFLKETQISACCQNLHKSLQLTSHNWFRK